MEDQLGKRQQAVAADTVVVVKGCVIRTRSDGVDTRLAGTVLPHSWLRAIGTNRAPTADQSGAVVVCVPVAVVCKLLAKQVE